MELQHRINAFAQLGIQIQQWLDSDDPAFLEVVQRSKHHNGWYQSEQVRFAFQSWAHALTQSGLESWTETYDLGTHTDRTIALVMAGNIPLVGFHDLLSVLLSGHKALVKRSSNDPVLLPFLMRALVAIEPRFEGRFRFTDEKMEGFDAVIATGSNNTARYFEHYFGKYPHIIRKNRNGVAVLDGSESQEQLEALAQDIFRYYGLGCRNVSKLFLPDGYDFDPFFNAMYSCRSVIEDVKYMNNYDYNKAVYLMSNIPLLDNEFMLLKEDPTYGSPIAVVHYEYYQDAMAVQQRLASDAQQIQCVVGIQGWPEMLPFGTAQHPGLSDYADGVDTLKFLAELA